MICDAEFNPKYQDSFVTIGKDHIAWWRVNGETSSIEITQQPVFDVSGILLMSSSREYLNVTN